MVSDVNPPLEAVYRSDWGWIIDTLIRHVGDFDIAEEAAQEAFAAAVEQWRVSGMPAFLRAWLLQTARHKAIDRIRRRTRFEENVTPFAASALTRTVEALPLVEEGLRGGPGPFALQAAHEEPSFRLSGLATGHGADDHERLGAHGDGVG